MATGPNYAAVRAGIATTLKTVPIVKTVIPYEKAQNFGLAQLPLAMIWHGPTSGTGLAEADAELGRFDYKDTWALHVHLNFTDDVKAQQDYDTLVSQLMAAFNGNMLIDPNGPGVVDVSRIVKTSPLPLLERDTPILLVEAELQTLILT